MKLGKKLRKSDLEEARDRLFELKSIQNEAREEEIAIREWIASQLHPEEPGAKTLTHEGIKLTITRPLAYSITADDAERLGRQFPDLDILRWKPEVKVAEFKKHADEVGEFISIKPGLVTVEFK